MQVKWFWSVVVYLIEAERRIYASVKQWLLVPRRQAIIWTSAGILLIGPLGIKFSDILIEINTFSFTKTHLEMLFAKWHHNRTGLNVSQLYHMCYLIKRNYRGRDVGSRILSSAVITRSNIVRCCTNNCRNWGRIWIRFWIHKRNPIPRPNGRAIGSLLRIFVRKVTAL